MKWKQLLMPSLAKILAFIILFSFFITLETGLIKNIIGSFKVFPQVHQLGLPLRFYKVGDCATLNSYPEVSLHCPPTFSIIKLIVDIIFWYLVSAFIVHLIHRKSNTQ